MDSHYLEIKKKLLQIGWKYRIMHYTNLAITEQILILKTAVYS